MKRLLCLLFALLLCTGCAGAEQAFPVLDTLLEGTITLLDGDFTLLYTLPQLIDSSGAAESVSGYYAQMEAQLASLWEPSALDEAFNGELSFQMTHGDERYVSFAFTLLSTAGNGESTTLFADTFAMDGLYAGQKVSLSQLLGLEEESTGPDELSLASRLAYQLVWQIIYQESQNPDGDYLDGLTEQQVQQAFDPEQDFYLDADGNVVFFIQSGEIAGEIAGILEYPFSIAEIISTLQ